MRNKLDPREVTVGILDCLGKKAILPTILEVNGNHLFQTVCSRAEVETSSEAQQSFDFPNETEPKINKKTHTLFLTT